MLLGEDVAPEKERMPILERRSSGGDQRNGPGAVLSQSPKKEASQGNGGGPAKLKTQSAPLEITHRPIIGAPARQDRNPDWLRGGNLQGLPHAGVGTRQRNAKEKRQYVLRTDISFFFFFFI